MLILATTALVCGVAVTVALGLHTAGTGGAPTKQAQTSPAAVQLLNRIALTADEQPRTKVRNDQYTYIKVTGFTTAMNGDTGTTERSSQAREEWTSVDGTGRTLQRAPGGDQWLAAPGAGSLSSPTYRLLEQLPTDPGHLLKTIYKDTNLNHGSGTDSTTGPDQEAFVAIGDLLRGMTAPPNASEALYRAAARIPGVITVPEAVDAAGRHGVAVARVHDGERTEWIFDKKSLHLLGECTVLLKDGAWGKAGAEVESIAIIGRGITDQPGHSPRAQS
ncbi:CU044_5270 family protein [Streptomyces sp. A5-4]|uniref:CU044_5270 family protein n=1 Tax=Streptomyces sp. A5-4 TaxID=3384771 RepID=UPI003DA922AC